jgi:hypothetical protein
MTVPAGHRLREYSPWFVVVSDALWPAELHAPDRCSTGTILHALFRSLQDHHTHHRRGLNQRQREAPMSSLKERGRSIPTKKIVSVLCVALSVQAGSRQPADGVRVERPQHSEDERPWGRQGLTQDGSGRGAVAGVAGPPSGGRSRGGSSIASDRWPRAARARVPVIPSPRQGGMELCGRSRAGSIKWATTPPSGGHDTHEHAPGCARAVHIASRCVGARQRTWPSRRP